MFVNINATPAARPRFLGEHDGQSHASVLVTEFKYIRGAEIFGEAEPAEYVYQVVEGAVRSYKLLSDGRRQIGAFHLVGDIFGLENGAMHRFTAEAIVDTSVRLAKRINLEHAARADALVSRELLSMTTGKVLHVFTGGVLAVAFSPDGRFIAVGNENAVALHELSNGTRVATLERHTDADAPSRARG